MPTPSLQRLERSIKQLRIGAVRDMEGRQKRAQADGLIEREEQYHIAVSGLAEEFFNWSTFEIKFATLFVDGTGQRDSPFDRPHVLVGSELYSPTPVALQAVVMGWKTTDRNETMGATVAIGVASSDKPTQFKGAVHLTFQGFGQPSNTFSDQELQP
jgi:hypothetical protein